MFYDDRSKQKVSSYLQAKLYFFLASEPGLIIVVYLCSSNLARITSSLIIKKMFVVNCIGSEPLALKSRPFLKFVFKEI